MCNPIVPTNLDKYNPNIFLLKMCPNRNPIQKIGAPGGI